MKRPSFPLVLGLLTFLGGAIFSSPGCSAGNDNDSVGADAVAATVGTGGTGEGMGGGPITVGIGGAGGGTGGAPINPCDSRCGPMELCDTVPVALDDDCDGEVDEGCACNSGSAQACFKGDPSYRNTPGCFPGTQHCTELGNWGSCDGGLHAWPPDLCQNADQTLCHAIESVPFLPVNLKTGTGNFSMGAATESWTVSCPVGVNPCPAVSGMNPADDFTPLVSGEYLVTYTRSPAYMNNETQCTYPLFVGAPGLRVELSWEWDNALGPDTVDLDLHMHKPNDYNVWGGTSGSLEDCAYDNCVATSFQFPSGNEPNWFTGVAPPDPVNWWLDPVFEKNTCYYGPKGNGADWQAIAMGCHNPRLDIDNIYCDPTVTDSQNFDFCNPENINIDYPPKDQWTRIGVHYYGDHGVSYNVHPVVRVFCNGRLAAELGNQGYNVPITFLPSEGYTRFWLVADVLFRDDECDDQVCYVEPLYLDPTIKSAILTTADIVQQSVGPSYPPVPMP